MSPIIFPGQAPESFAGLLKELAARMGEMEFAAVAEALGGQMLPDGLLLPSFGRRYRVSRSVILDTEGRSPSPTHSVVLSYYVLEGGASVPLSGKWIAFRDFKDSAFFMPAFREAVEQRLAREFQGRLAILHSCSEALGGRDYPELGTGDLCHLIPALPRVPLLLVFHEGDEEFPASTMVLYDSHSTSYLNLECLGVMGAVLADRPLEERDGRA
jgi:hypothetical protein